MDDLVYVVKCSILNVDMWVDVIVVVCIYVLILEWDVWGEVYCGIFYVMLMVVGMVVVMFFFNLWL